MAIAHEPAAPEPGRFRRASENPLVRAVGRIPVPIRAKQLFGSVVVAALLVLVAVLALVALGQSNARGTELRTLQQRGGYEQLLLTDATQLKHSIDYRLRLGAEYQGFSGYTPSYVLGFVSAFDQQIGNQFTRLCLDAGVVPTNLCIQLGSQTFLVRPTQNLPLTLKAIAPSLPGQLVGASVFGSTRNPVSLFDTIAASAGHPQGPLSKGGLTPRGVRFYLVRAKRWAASFAGKLAALTRNTRTRADALVASNRSSYNQSRDLLIGAGVGSFLLALALGLLLSDSLLVPLRLTQKRLAAIAGGDFSGRLEVPNRDEIGTLAADVNRMSDELQRLYRELETASRHKSDFLATMSHELRTPLNAIIGFSEVLHEQMFGELNERQLGYVDDVLAAGRHLLSLINDVLDLAKIEAGKMELELSRVALPDLFRSAVSMHSERAARERVELSLTTEPDEITITADERRLRQVAFNLLSNAVKFTPAGGRIDVSAKLADGEVQVAVADTGVGIAADDLETIFEEFEQARDGKQADGTGLGLSLSRKLVELHGGRIWAESEPGHGSTFRFTLPVRQEPS